MMWNKEKRNKLISAFSVLLSVVLFSCSALANPVVDNVAGGQVAIQQTSTNTTVNQTSQKAIINWQSFNIGANESTHFQQPTGGIALNRINPTQGVSQIYGRLTATGQIILSNPAGVYFGPGSYVNVAGIIATTANMTDQDFMDGNYRFNKVPGYDGAVVNEGQIIAAQHGLVALVAPGVINKGVIQADLGKVVLASGDAYVVNLSGDGLYNFKITEKTTSRGVDKDGNTLSSGVVNTGSLIANGGKILVTAQAAAGVLDNSIDMRGVAIARSVYQQNGEIIVSGDPNAGLTKVAANLDASAGETGINGGFVETSGHLIDLTGIHVNLSGNTGGQSGTWLIDPVDLTICTACTTTALLSGSTYDAGSSNSNLLVTDLVTALGSGNVIVQTTSAGSGGNGDIFVNTDINWSSANKLTLSAYRHITSSANISNTGGGSLVLQADNTGTGTGTVSFTAGKNISLSGGSGTATIYYNPTTFGTQDTIYTGGTASTQYMLINNATNLNAVSTSTSWSENYALGRDIDASSLVGFTSIGSSGTPFTGHFDGQSHKISNLTINAAGSDDIGLFGVIGAAGVIENIAVSGSVSGKANVGLLAGTNAGTIMNAFTYGIVMGAGNNVGGLVGSNSGTISNTYSTASVTAASSNNVGGLAGSNSGTINTSFSAGMVTGNASTGGLVGSNSGTVNNSYWDTDTSGQASSAGGTGATTANMMLQATFAGFDFSNTWGIISGKSYPYLLSFYPATPRVFSGTLNDTDPLTSTVYTNTNQTIKLANNGSLIDSVQTGANGFFYFLAGNSDISTSDALLAYVSGSATKGNVVTVAPTSGASITDFYIDPNHVTVENNGTLDYGYTIIYPGPVRTYMTYISNDDLANAKGSLSDTDILYSASGSDINVSDGYNFVTGENTFYALTGNLSTTNGSITFGGYETPYTLDPYLLSGCSSFTATSCTGTYPATVTVNAIVQVGPLASAYNGIQTVQTNTSGDITNNAFIVWPNDLSDVTDFSDANLISITDNHGSPNTDILHLITASNIIINEPIVGFVGRPGRSNLFLVNYVRAGLYLTAPYVDQSITTGPSGAIYVDEFNLLQGKWYQNSPYISGPNIVPFPFGITNVIPTYYLFANNFRIDSSNLPSPKAQFIRTRGGDGTLSNPYKITDNYSLQGVGSDSTTLSAAWKVDEEIGYWNDGLFTLFWNDGAGFVPIGNATTPFSGDFDGGINEGHLILLNMEWPGLDNIGLFGVNTGTIHDLAFAPGIASGNNNVGALVGTNWGIIHDVEINGLVTGSNNVGGIVGLNHGSIIDSINTGAFVKGETNVGVIAGYNDGTINRTLSFSFPTGSSNVGAIVGNNAGTIMNSFWDADYMGLKKATGTNSGTLTNVIPGCFTGNCSFGSAKLSSSTPYIAKGWDFSSSGPWGIIEGKSLPYHKKFFDVWTPLIILSGFTQPKTSGLTIAAIVGPTTLESKSDVFASQLFYTRYIGSSFIFDQPLTGFADETPFGPYSIANSTAGANGFFINTFFGTGVANKVVLIAVAGGSATGQISFVLPSSGGVSNLILPITTGTPPTATPTNYLQIYANILGIPYSSLLNANLGNANQILTAFHDYLDSVNAYTNYLYQQYLQNLYINNTNSYYLGESNTFVVVSNVKTIMAFQEMLDKRILNMTEVIPIAPHCPQ